MHSRQQSKWYAVCRVLHYKKDWRLQASPSGSSGGYSKKPEPARQNEALMRPPGIPSHLTFQTFSEQKLDND